MTTALLLFLTVTVALTAVTVFVVNQLKNAPIGFENETGFHFGEPQQVAVVAIAPVVSIDDSHPHAA